MTLRLLTEPPPPHDRIEAIAPGIRRLVAPNAGPMTYHGTNTYLFAWDDGVAVLDPGPDDAAHRARLLAAGPIRAILLTHGHRDHWGGLAPLLQATRATLYASERLDAGGLVPDVKLREGDWAAGLEAWHTPGHAGDHLCFRHPSGLVFSGDHVMGWSTTVVLARHGGDMRHYFASLERLLDTDAALFLPGHGPPIPDPAPHVAALLAHRRAREAAILAALEKRPESLGALTDRVYPGLAPDLREAAEANVDAHLQKLAWEGRAGGLRWPAQPTASAETR